MSRREEVRPVRSSEEEEVPRLRTRPPVEVGGFFLRRNPSPQRIIGRQAEGTAPPPRRYYQEAFMTQMFVYGIAAIVVSVGAALFARQRRAAYAVVRPARPRRSRVR